MSLSVDSASSSFYREENSLQQPHPLLAILAQDEKYTPLIDNLVESNTDDQLKAMIVSFVEEYKTNICQLLTDIDFFSSSLKPAHFDRLKAVVQGVCDSLAIQAIITSNEEVVTNNAQNIDKLMEQMSYKDLKEAIISMFKKQIIPSDQLAARVDKLSRSLNKDNRLCIQLIINELETENKLRQQADKAFKYERAITDGQVQTLQASITSLLKYNESLKRRVEEQGKDLAVLKVVTFVGGGALLGAAGAATLLPTGILTGLVTSTATNVGVLSAGGAAAGSGGVVIQEIINRLKRIPSWLQTIFKKRAKEEEKEPLNFTAEEIEPILPSQDS